MNVGSYNPLPGEPDPRLVESAIGEVLVAAQRHGITPAEFVQLLDAGMQISDFLSAMNSCTDANLYRSRPAIDLDSPC
jgi:hypothetical protein